MNNTWKIDPNAPRITNWKEIERAYIQLAGSLEEAKPYLDRLMRVLCRFAGNRPHA